VADPATTLLLSREDAAGLLGVSRRTFDRHVSPHLPRVQIGTLIRYHREDLDAWLERKKVGPFAATPEPGSTRSASASPVVVLTGRRARAIEQRLRDAQPRSSKKR